MKLRRFINEKILKWVGIAFVAIIILAIIIPKEDKKEIPDKNTEIEENVDEPKVEEPKEIAPDVTVSAKDLAKAFEDNEIKANKDYRDKTAEITGKIDSIGEVLGSTYIILSAEKDFSITQVQCYFEDEAEINKIADMSKGQTVTVIGKIEGKSMNVEVKNCKFK